MTRVAGTERMRRAGPSPVRRGGLATWLAIGLGILFLALTVLVVTGVTQPLDSAVFHRLRPGDGWGDAQIRWSPWMSRLRPQHGYVLLGATSVAAALWRRSWWPLVFAVVLAGVSGVVTVAVKVATHRPDPHGFVTESGGSYPSGHTVALVVCLGACLLLVWPRVHWWLWAPLLVALSLMTSGLLVSGAHWLTDVLGGALLAFALLACSSRTMLRNRAHRREHAAVVAVTPAITDGG